MQESLSQANEIFGEPVEISNFSEMETYDTFYHVWDGVLGEFFAVMYRDADQDFIIAFQKIDKGLFNVSLFTQEFGFVDVEGMNVFKYTSRLRKIVNTFKFYGWFIEKIDFTHVSDYLKLSQAITIKEYLKKKGYHVPSGFYAAGDLANYFVNYASKDPGLEDQELELLKFFKGLDRKNAKLSVGKLMDNMKYKRFEIFFPITRRALKGLKVTFQVNKPDFRVTFL